MPAPVRVGTGAARGGKGACVTGKADTCQIYPTTADAPHWRESTPVPEKRTRRLYFTPPRVI